MEEKLSLLKQLIILSKSDKDFHSEEYHFISLIANSLGVSKEDLDPLFNKYIKFTPPKLEPFRIVQFQRLVLLSNVDLSVSDQEINNLKKAGFLLGLREGAINTILDQMKNHERGLIPKEKLMEIFKVYHN